MITLRKNQTVFLEDVEYLVISGSAEFDTMLENKKTGERSIFKTFNLVTKYLTGDFKTAEQRQEQLHLRTPGRPPARMDNLTTRAKKETHRRIDYLVRLEREGSFSKSRAALAADLEKIGSLRGEAAVPHVSTVFRWRRMYQQAQRDVRALFARFDQQGGKGKTRLAPSVELMIDEVIDEVALKQRTFSAEELRAGLRLKIDAANRARGKDEQLLLPSLRTVQRRARMLSAFELTTASKSLEEAERRFAIHGASRPVCRLLEMVEIDHSPVDLIVVGDDRTTRGRPTITVVFDRATRCVLGYHLSLAGHGVPAVFDALRHALLPKTYLAERYRDLNLRWECFGWFERLLMDNGREFHADAVADALLNLGITTEFAASRSPNDKPFVERFLRTFNYGLIHKLKGTTLAKSHKRVGFKPEDDAVLTLEELDRIIHVWICMKYHVRPHLGLDGRAPITVWRELAKIDPPQLKMNVTDIEIEFSEVTESRLQHYGIDLNSFVYRSPKLLTMGRLLPAKPTVSVKWPRHDVGHIWVWDTISNEYMKVPNSRPEYAGLTLEQAKTARKAKGAGDPSYAQTQAEAGSIIRGLVAEAEAASTLAKRRRGSRLGNRTSRPFRDPLSVGNGVCEVSELDEGGEIKAVTIDEVIHDVAIDLPTFAEEV